MKPSARWLVLGAAVTAIFASGVFLGSRFFHPDSSAARPENTQSIHAKDRQSARAVRPTLAVAGSSDPADEALVRRIREARALPEDQRAGRLLRTLEETTKRPLTPGLLAEFRSVLNEGELDSCHYLLSLMEQREEKSSVNFLLEAAAHPDPDVVSRALFALEAVAGTVFKDREAAITWASTWKPDPDRAKLFSSPQGSSDDEFSSSPTRESAPNSPRTK